MTTDKTRRKLRIGQVVDVVMLGTFHGMVMDIKESPIILSQTQQLPPHVVIQIISTPYIAPDGSVADVYILKEPDPQKGIITH